MCKLGALSKARLKKTTYLAIFRRVLVVFVRLLSRNSRTGRFRLTIRLVHTLLINLKPLYLKHDIVASILFSLLAAHLGSLESRFAVRNGSNRHRLVAISNRMTRIARSKTVESLLKLHYFFTFKVGSNRAIRFASDLESLAIRDSNRATRDI